MDLSVLIVNFNTKELLQRCLESINNSEKESYQFEVIVVDNASSDQSAEMIKKKFPNVNLISSKKNLGFAAGNNLGIKMAVGEYVLLLNPDTEIEINTFKIMIDYLKSNPKVGAATCRVELKNGKLDDACHRGFPTPWNAFCHFSGISQLFPNSCFLNGYHLGYQNLDKIHEIDSCAGAFLLVRKEIGDSINWLDEDYFWYGEDLDFCYRVKQKGWKIMYVPIIKILHWKGASSGIRQESKNISNASLETRKKAVMASTQAMRLFYQKHYLKKYPSIITGFVLFGINYLEKRRLTKI
ncbi:glycosyl transferase family 2 [Candidatus Shapirobacteria bacterium CG08_land_8_20_14_0_20_39_18]|uniref:Glycosyl transferase family 2 n=1 Tax=Candidatus Shapirobacteria bacterium CG08_land_8_20_14_0_20_39_18 TaxID=1974883 RepID=A0A2M6XC17_9BACT|nr:MAG: glycosyl transferase family 2 [Candidatus Shapirobacteria bacterium CG08_land_8_20_14_0_20_39_18]PIY65389.1 MAG: glycosyl transferase family 2 [Candidatus Shapirobacteria bacterium CG_4_10_14_0_8_um_filter_39_15]PJE68594.1 MAG: glycosyl transferase family 2 [Candidatus Shapirobacteria bacterium CG10_big_fil_rev_8_21_14_0_10_38_8]